MKHKINGFTLLESLISLVLLGIVSSIVLPNLSRILAQNRLDNSMASVFKGLHLARGYAVSNATNITVCPLVAGSCIKEWQNDIYVFEDANGSLSLDSNEFIIKVIKKINNQDELTYPRKAITYRADSSISFMQSGSFIYCNSTYPDLTGNRITVSQVGRVRILDSDKCEVPNL